MANEIYKTGRMYVVWPAEPDIKSPQDGIEKVIESIRGTGAEYGSRTEDAIRIVQDTAREYAEEDYFSARGVPNQVKPTWKEFVKDYGPRAIYEVRVRQVGTVDAEGNFTEIKAKVKTKRK